jgi:hypothetical protein
MSALSHSRPRKRTRVQADGVGREVPLTNITGASFDTFVGAQDEGYNSIPSLAGVFNLCDRRFDTRSGCMTWHLMKK